MSKPHVSFETHGVRYESHLTDNDARAAVEGIDYFTSDGSVDGEELSRGGQRRRRASLSIRMPPPQSQAGLAFTALQYLPMPVLVLSSTKHIVLANEAIGRLLGIDLAETDEDDENEGEDGTHDEEQDVESTADLLQGKTLGELGIDLLQGGNAVCVSWEDILQNVVDDASKAQKAYKRHCEGLEQEKEDDAYRGDTRKRSHSVASSKHSLSGMKKTTEVHDIVFSTARDSSTGLPRPAPESVTEQVAHASAHMQAKMIISVWATEEDQYFTLTFTAAADVDTSKTNSSLGSASHSGSTTELSKRVVSRPVASLNSGFPSAVSSNSSSSPSDPHRKSRRSRGSPTGTPNIPSPMNFPPRGPPDKAAQAAAPTIFTKSNRLKDAILNSMSFPAYAMWRDQTFGVPNKAAIQLLYPYADTLPDTNESATEFLSRYVLYREDFDELIPLDDIPIMRLMRQQERFEGYRVGMYSAKDGSRNLYDVQGEPMLDDKGVFIGGLVVFNDVTGFQNTINEERIKNERQFEIITNMVPQMIWRTTPTGEHDYYSKRWYDYTGLTVEQSEGEGWMNGFHPDDLEIAGPKWAHSLATGDEYLTEYRARSAAGEWRWMLGRAVPMRDEHGEILKWFGTCTDVHDQVLAREEAKQTRAQLERVIEHARITLWAVDLDAHLTLFEGKAMYEPDNRDLPKAKQSLLGTNLWDIFKLQGRTNEMQTYKQPVEAILSGKTADETVEQEISSTNRWFRTRLVPILRHERAGGIEGEAFIDGVVGVSMDVTEMKQAEQGLQRRNQDNANLMAQSVAAKEASKMKSQFLANMSHEIRTPIAGVIGMSELLLDDDIGELTKDQRECAENIQRSANGLLCT
jgi:PAS domain S-box-containing protein